MILSLLLTLFLAPGTAPVEGGVVAGTLRGPDGSPAARVRVGVMTLPEAGRGVRGAGTLISQAETDDAGRFQLEEVPPGRYYIVAGKLQTPTFYPGVETMGAAKTIQVSAKATVRDIDFTVGMVSSSVKAPVAKITGRIVLNNPNAPMPPNITLKTFPVGPATTVTLPVAQDGTFKADLVAAVQHLSVIAPPGYSVVAFAAGGTNLLAQPINVKSGVELLVSLNVGDDRARYRLMALVREDSTDRLLAGERVELVHSSGEIIGLTVNAQGMVTFPGLLQGTYILRLASANFDVAPKQVVITDSSVQVELRPRNKP
jgi:hypothetical protein